MKLQIDDRERLVLAAVQHRAQSPLSEIRALTGLREHQLRYVLDRLHARGIILGRSAFVDVYPLGFTYFSLSFSFHPDRQAKSREIVDAFLASPHVAFMGLVGGEYQYLVTLCVRRVDEVHTFLETLSRAFGNFMLDKSVGAHISFYLYGRKYLTSRKLPYPVLAYGSRGQDEYQLSPLDRKLLSIWSLDSNRSIRDISRELSQPASTLHRHQQALERAEILKGDRYRINLQAVGALQFKILVFGRGIDPEVTAEMEKLCRRDPVVVRFISCLGSWNYEIDIELIEAEQVNDFLQRLFERFGREINSVKVLQIFRHLKFAGYPLADPKSDKGSTS